MSSPALLSRRGARTGQQAEESRPAVGPAAMISGLNA